MRRNLLLSSLALCLVLVAAGAVLPACGSNGQGANSTITSTTVGVTSGPGTLDTSVTTSQTGPDPLTSEGPSSSDTTVFTGTTLSSVPGQSRALTFVGEATKATWQALRKIVIDAAGDGDRVLAALPSLTQGPPVEVADVELDAVRGVGYAAGADSSQPLAVALGDDGAEVTVLAFSVTGKPDMTTIAGFERHTYHVVLVEGPLPISDSTGNITTVPGY